MNASTAMALVQALIALDGWIYVGAFQDPPAPPPGFVVETCLDGFLGIVTHYRFVPSPSAGADRKEAA